MTNIVNILVAPRFSRQGRLDYIMWQWSDMPWVQRVDPYYSISASYWHTMVD